MKRIGSILLAVALLAVAFALPTPVQAEVYNGRYFGQTDTCDATGVAGVYLGFTGAIRQAGVVPRIQTANVTSDLSTSVVTLITENGDSTTTDAAYSSGGKILPVTATTSFQDTTAGAGSWIAIYDFANDKFEINRVSSITAGVSLNLIRNTDNTYASGSTVYELGTTIGTVVVGNTTKDWPTLNLIGVAGKTLGITVNGTSSCSINAVFGDYIPQ